jgi:Lrp/AsnC family transcriptional regulator of lysine biosynthesis
MDNVDFTILETLKRDSRTKYVRIAEVVNLTEGAVRRRVKKMLAQGIIKKFTIETTIEVEGIVLVKTNPDETRSIATKIKAVSDRVFEVSGDYDIAALIQAHTIEELNKKVDEIRSLPAILNTNTLIKLKGD